MFVIICEVVLDCGINVLVFDHWRGCLHNLDFGRFFNVGIFFSAILSG